MEFNHKILVVDDEPNLRTTLSLILQRDGYVVTTAGGADEAHEKLQAQAFDLVFLDIKMPKKSGLMLLTEIKQLFPDLPVLLLTAFASLDSAIEAVRRGAADYLLKPIDPPQILSRVRQVLSEQQPNRRRAIMNEMQRLLGELNEIDGFHTEETPGQATPAEESERYLRRGPFILDLHTRVASLNTEELSLTPTGFDYLTVLMRFSPNTLGYQKLVLEAQGYETTPIEAKEVTRWRIHELRKAIEQDSRNPRYLITVRGEGYRLVT
ncbi:MAG: response regulator transcription factor [Ardenticatenaceae bacterium]|nr:response regulator transcription factor [Ardenticatenaceae bacterium]MCB8948629.1 response regulator transcription factor [Ardenticatenaceae bacterium]